MMQIHCPAACFITVFANILHENVSSGDHDIVNFAFSVFKRMEEPIGARFEGG